MFRVEQTAEFSEWLDGLRDERAQLKIAQRIMRMQGGNPGDWKSLGGGLSEMRIDYGPGYRCYYTIRERVICLLICGSDKKDQDRAIRQARELLKNIE
jgi:putative addiction module killer protein